MEGLQTLEPVDIPGHRPTSTGNVDHPMRLVTRRAAGLVPGGWTPDLRRDVAARFDSLATEWHTRDTPQRRAVVTDALERGLAALRGAEPTGTAVEVGSGTGTYSALLASYVSVVVSVEIAEDMLRTGAWGPAAPLLADASELPLADLSVDVVAAVNAFLFPAEVGRILRPGGALVWVNVSGSETPIHLSTSEVVEALPFEVDGVESRAGVGTWCVLRRIG